jgi:formiminotetrahydrofolate cyclodeaminase
VSISDTTLKDVLTALASDAPSPGSGAAASVTLAFAAACAGKAVAITRKHRPAEADYLSTAERRLKEIMRASLERADSDAALFESFIHHKGREAAKALVRADESAQGLGRELGAVLDEIAPNIHPVMAADIAAARALLSAVGLIESRIRAENQQAVEGAT